MLSVESLYETQLDVAMLQRLKQQNWAFTKTMHCLLETSVQHFHFLILF